ncbi:unnamed protein product [marine sediment metagenome]|uniref:Uncharacterized protein n=1 Tax=marine sediment metagenome TaxID=412755 RepID=X0XZE4_9ZZZZ
MSSIWQEIDKLRKEVSRLERLVARQYVKQAAHPILRCGDITSDSESGSSRVYNITERDVDAQRADKYIEVWPMGDDPGPPAGQQPVVFYVDNAGKRYILPFPQRLIAIRDEGASEGKHVEIDETGTVTVPTGSEKLDYIVAERASFFHNSTNTTKTGRIYPGMKLVSNDGLTKYYLIFVEAHGDLADTFTDTLDISEVSSIAVDLDVDGQGNLLGVDLRAG